MSLWTVARTSIACEGGCRRQIGAGEALRLVSGLEWPCCTDCAKRRFDQEPPAIVPSARQSFEFKAAPMTRLGAVPLPRDFKVAQSKDGE
jgi:hypothetical protein